MRCAIAMSTITKSIDVLPEYFDLDASTSSLTTDELANGLATVLYKTLHVVVPIIIKNRFFKNRENNVHR